MKMNDQHRVTNSSQNDMEIIFGIFNSAIEYQKKNGFELWPVFSRGLIEKEIAEKRHWKILHNNEIAAIFSVCYNDPVIWGEKDKDPSVYLHRIAVHPSFKGKGIIGIIKTWAEEHARQNNKNYLRMDTWGNNKTLRDYYIKAGFNYIGQQHLVKTEGLPEHYGGNILSLFQNEV
jgi:GNAT superfamily N-acetyltransferase